MASPQIENGYTRIANEFLEALAAIRIPGEAMQVFMVILRKTYGFRKKEDAIALSQFHLATGIIKPSIIRAAKTLEGMRIISISRKANSGIPVYRIIKDYSTWRPLAKKLTVKNVSERANTVSNKANTAFTKKLPTKETTTKETITKEKPFLSDSIEIRLSELLLNFILARKPDLKKPDVQAWAIDINRMLNLEGRTPERVEAVVRWCQQDSFWQNNILSASKLRAQFDQLELKMQSKKSDKNSVGVKVDVSKAAEYDRQRR